jgi:type I restriction enzyme S subunit
MNPTRLLAQFERLADAPDAVPRLRRFILNLAVRGRLIPQDSNDEPASELLKRVGKLPPPPRYSKRSVELIPGDCGLSINEPDLPVPSGWIWVPLVQVARIESGHTPSRNRPDWWNGHVPWMGLVDARAHDNRRIFDTIQHTNEAGLANSAARLLPEGTVCFSRTASVGYVVIMGRPMATSQDFVNWVPTEAISSEWLQLVMIAERPAIPRFSKGAVHQTIYYPAWLSMYVALPPLAEQHRIAAKVDELMALCDRLEVARNERESRRDRLVEASLHSLTQPTGEDEPFRADARFYLNHLARLTTRLEHVKQLRQTILNLAVRGRLVPQDPSDEPVSELLKRIAADRSEHATGRGRRASTPRSPSGDDQPHQVPSHWTWAAFGDVTISRDGERIPVSREDRASRSKIYDYYGASGIIDKIDGYLFDKPLLLIGEDGANLINRSTPIAFIARGRYWVNNHAHVIDGLCEPFLRYLELFINATNLRPYVTGTAQPKMNQAKMNSVPVALPPLPEQHRILAKVDELMVLCDRLESSLVETETDSHRLLEAVLHEALQPAENALEAAE